MFIFPSILFIIFLFISMLIQRKIKKFSFKKKTMLHDGIFQGMYGSITVAWWSEYNKDLYKDLKWSWANSDLAKLSGENSERVRKDTYVCRKTKKAEWMEMDNFPSSFYYKTHQQTKNYKFIIIISGTSRINWHNKKENSKGKKTLKKRKILHS